MLEKACLFLLNSFHATGLFLHPLKNYKNPDISMEYGKKDWWRIAKQINKHSQDHHWSRQRSAHEITAVNQQIYENDLFQ